jgi:hypothetical protein
MIRKFLVIFLLIVSACGYQPIYLNQNSEKLIFNKISQKGDNDINRKILNYTSLKEDKLNKSLNELLLFSNFDVQETVKSLENKSISFRINVISKISITKNEKILKSKVFSKSFNFDSKESRYELIEYQNKIKDQLINKISDDIVLFLITE